MWLGLIKSWFNGRLKYSKVAIRSCSVKKVVSRNFAKFTEKHLCQRLFLNKVAGLYNFVKKGSLAQVLSCEFCKISKNTFFHRTPPDDCCYFSEIIWGDSCKACQNTVFLSPVFSRIFDFVLYKKIRVRENAFFNIICAEDEYSVSPFMTVTEYELIISM